MEKRRKPTENKMDDRLQEEVKRENSPANDGGQQDMENAGQNRDDAKQSSGGGKQKAGKDKSRSKEAKSLRLIMFVCLAALAVLVVLRIFKPREGLVTKPLSTVSVSMPQTGSIYLETSLVGTRMPADVYPIVPKTAGEITRIYVSRGDHVNEGDPICEIDNQKQIDAARISLEGAAVQVNNLEESVKLAKTNLGRMQTLYGSGDISRQSYEQAKSAYDQAVAGLEGAKLQQEGAQLQYDTQLEFATVTAPVSGTVESVSMTLKGIAAQTTPLCVITTDGEGKIQFQVTDRLLDSLKAGDAVRIEKHGSVYDGKVSSVDALPNSMTGLYPVEVVSRDGGSIAQGASVKVFFVSEKAENVLTVATDAVYYDGGKTYVYTVSFNSGGEQSSLAAEGNRTATVHKTEVVTGLSDTVRTEILSGITENDPVIGTWTAQLYEGAQVQVLPSEGV